MVDFLHSSSAPTGERNHQMSDFTEDLSPDEAPSDVRRKSSVRFLDEVTTINAGDGAGDTEPAAVMQLRSKLPTIRLSSPSVVPPIVVVDNTVQTTPGRESAQLHRWRTDRKEREERMQQNINWLREEITKLKQQDQSLMRQFLQLRSVIYQLKGTVTSGQRSVVRLPRIAASTESLARYTSAAEGLEELGVNEELMMFEDDDDLMELDDQMGLMEDPYLPEFRGRTVSLLNPGNINRGSKIGSGGFGYLKSRTMSFSVGTSARELDRAIVE